MKKNYYVIILLLFQLQAWAHGNNAAQLSAKQPLSFIENKKQWDSKIICKADLPFGSLFLEKDRFTYHFALANDWPSHPKNHLVDGQKIHTHSYQQVFNNADLKNVSIEKSEALSSYHNYFLGNDATRWSSHCKLYQTITYNNIYKGINLKVYSYNNTFKYDFIVQPNVSADQISITFNNAGKISITKGGNLKINTSVNEIIEQTPYSYQIINNKKVSVPTTFVLKDSTLTFKIGKYNPNYQLIIDPTLIFCTYTGSTVDNWGTSACYDNVGNLYAAGIVVGLGYPTTAGAFQTTYGGGTSAANSWNPYYGDISITKFNATGTNLIYSTFLGGSGNDFPNSTIVTPNDELIVLGRSYSSNYPVTAGAYDPSYNGGGDIVVTKFDFTGGGLIGSTYIGDSGEDGVNFSSNENILGSLKRNYGDDARGEVNYDVNDNVYIASCTFSTNFPVTAGAYQTSFGGGLEDGVVFKLNPNLSSLVWSTYLGGSLNDACYSLDINNFTGQVYVTGGTESTNFPTSSNAYNPSYKGGTADGFLVNLSANGSTLLASTFIGSTTYDQSYFVKLDGLGNPYVMGQTSGNAYPLKPASATTPLYTNSNSGQFISKFKPTLDSILISTVIGNGNGMPNLSPTAFTVDICDNVYFAGWGGDFLGMSPGNLGNMPMANALQTTTDQATKSDFYIAVLDRNMSNLTLGTYYGGNGSLEHVDGGTSRFDKNGYIYGAICAGCITNDSYLQATAGAWSSTNQSNNCNLAAYKIQVGLTSLDVIATANPDTFGCAPFVVQFTNGTVAPHYDWNFGDGTAHGTTQNPTHTYTTVDTFYITLIVTDSSTCNIVDSTHLIVITTDDSVFAAFTVPDSAVCIGQPVYFTDTTNNATSIQWFFGDNTTSTAHNPTHIYFANGIYNVMFVASNPATCNKTDTFRAIITVGYDSAHASFTANTLSGCAPLAVSFTGSLCHPWASYSWQFGNSALVTNTLTPSFTFPLGTHIVQFTVYDSLACVQRDTFTQTIIADSLNTLAAAIPSQWSGCNPFTVQFQNNSIQGLTYIWDFGDASPPSTSTNPTHTYNGYGFYTITLIANNPFSCKTSDTFHFNIFNDTVRVRALATVTPTTGCIPLNVNFVNNSIHAVSYYWDFGNGNTSTLQNPGTQIYPNTGTFNITLIATDTSTCNDNDTATYIITPYYNETLAKFTLQDTAACKSLNLSITNLSTTGATYAWDFGDNTFSTLYQPSKTYPNVGDYKIKLVVTDNTKCKPVDSTDATVHVYTEPIASILVDTTVNPSDTLFHFSNLSANADSYDWYYNGIYAGSTQNLDIGFHPLGHYNVCVVARTAQGCDDTACITVSIEFNPQIGVPNAFSPDGDGHNDFFKVYGIGIEKLLFRVYNRWGQLIFESTDQNVGWDGYYKGELQPIEVYAWTVNATFITGENKNLKGNVTLVR